MDSEAAIGDHLHPHKKLSKKRTSDTASPLPLGSAVSAVGSCFDCNICLDITVDPVVILCGHLYYYPASISSVAVEFSGSRAEALQFQIKSKMTLVAGVLPGDDDDDRRMANKQEAQLGMYSDCSFAGPAEGEGIDCPDFSTRNRKEGMARGMQAKDEMVIRGALHEHEKVQLSEYFLR
ncbi:E3 ubiquitin-protein ligase RMA3 [Apostasia shenzhenica]|uniref:E3 ubiquitin-protein ligase RMA3 n=1 Tax=Apostasia shenzhenica TaxID=1088818 RepID=A0A2I0A314_9ASPA|nr:E3 ubiquitin-protein ligase RMA3 [Apostasia shenzhenica]